MFVIASKLFLRSVNQTWWQISTLVVQNAKRFQGHSTYEAIIFWIHSETIIREHGLFCFSNSYDVEGNTVSVCAGTKSPFTVQILLFPWSVGSHGGCSFGVSGRWGWHCHNTGNLATKLSKCFTELRIGNKTCNSFCQLQAANFTNMHFRAYFNIL